MEIVLPNFGESETLRASRSHSPAIAAAQRRPTRRLEDMDLEPPEGPVPDDVIAHFTDAVRREAEREARRDTAA